VNQRAAEALPIASGDVLARLQAAARAHGFELDPPQKRAAQAFQRLYEELAARQRTDGWLSRWLRRPVDVRGVYLWGGVGRGKSFLMDAFFALAPRKRKRRVHFHRFMQEIHRRLRELQGRSNPLLAVAQREARKARLLCLDEFHIIDIGDAMLMRGLLEGLFQEGVALVTTSNEHPTQLYAHGLQRAQFLPAIQLIERHLEIVELAGEQDYRLRTLEHAGVYHSPLDERACAALEEAFVGVAGEAGERDVTLEIEGRTLRARRAAPGTAWFDFEELCEGPRGTADYIELARRYHTILIWGVPQFQSSMAESMRRFTWLVDEFYDRRVKLIVAAQAPVDRLYECIEARPELERTRSRMIEMRSAHYLSQPHLA
jgi:cell division protein ZapE